MNCSQRSKPPACPPTCTPVPPAVGVAILQECDVLRDETLVELGVRLEDREQSCVVKLVGKDAILEERERDRKVCRSLPDQTGLTFDL